jgi:hypothetical protein
VQETRLHRDPDIFTAHDLMMQNTQSAASSLSALFSLPVIALTAF